MIPREGDIREGYPHCEVESPLAGEGTLEWRPKGSSWFALSPGPGAGLTLPGTDGSGPGPRVWTVIRTPIMDCTSRRTNWSIQTSGRNTAHRYLGVMKWGEQRRPAPTPPRNCRKPGWTFWGPLPPRRHAGVSLPVSPPVPEMPAGPMWMVWSPGSASTTTLYFSPLKRGRGRGRGRMKRAKLAGGSQGRTRSLRRCSCPSLGSCRPTHSLPAALAFASPPPVTTLSRGGVHYPGAWPLAALWALGGPKVTLLDCKALRSAGEGVGQWGCRDGLAALPSSPQRPLLSPCPRPKEGG